MRNSLFAHTLISISFGALASLGCGGSEPPPSAPKPYAEAPTPPAPPPAPAAEVPKTATPAAPAKAEPADPADMGGTIYKKLFENAVVRIFEVTFKAGEKTPLHKHPDHVVYALTAGKLHIAPSEGAAQDVDLKPGQAMMLSAQAHVAENTGTSEVKLAVFELKGPRGAPAPKGADPTAVAGNVYKKILDNDRVRVFEATFAKGTKLPAHVHPEFAAYVVTAGKLKLTDPSKPKAEATQELDLTAGFAGFLPAQTHTAENAGATPVKLVVVEVKPEPGAVAEDATKSDKKPDAKKPAPKK